jgi:hypothetical protein
MGNPQIQILKVVDTHSLQSNVVSQRHKFLFRQLKNFRPVAGTIAPQFQAAGMPDFHVMAVSRNTLVRRCHFAARSVLQYTSPKRPHGNKHQPTPSSGMSSLSTFSSQPRRHLRLPFPDGNTTQWL